ncbi:NB-ARC domain-containing protein [Streptomyces purpurascens]|uniref:NB-ARC domain-containing protein n=1 Tax=Streptomyces purpurascens TaxID=1924 RepID=UPI0033C092B9
MRKRGLWGRAAAVALGVAAVVWLLLVTIRHGWAEADPVASVLGSIAGVSAFAFTLLASNSGATEKSIVRPSAPGVGDWVVARDEIDQVVGAVCRRSQDATVAITTGLKGAGGFGKTTLARLVCAHPQVRKHFGQNVYFVTIGRDIRGRSAIAAKVAEVTYSITGVLLEGEQDPEQMGSHLGELLARRPRSLLVLDDIWDIEQLAPFLRGANDRCVRLVTTRNPNSLPPHAEQITVDRLSATQAHTLLTQNLRGALPQPLSEELVQVTGRWALLLRMTNQLILALTKTGTDPAVAASQVLERLARFGPASTDPDNAIELDEPERRNQAVRASIQAATALLPPDTDRRFNELGIFAEDESIPLNLVVSLWQTTAGLDETRTRLLCKQMADLSLLAINADTPGGALSLHDVMRDYARAELGPRLATVNGVLIDALAILLPSGRDAVTSSGCRAWWQVDDAYVLNHLVAHLLDADRQHEAQSLAGDIRWVKTRLRRWGPTAPVRDLDLVNTTNTRAWAADLLRASHLLSATNPEHCLDSVLRSRLHALPHWNTQASNITVPTPALIDNWPPPDLPHPSLRRTLTGYANTVMSVAISSDGTWLVATSEESTAHICDTVTGREIHTLTGHTDSVVAVAISPDDTWIATASNDHTARIWDAATGQQRHILTAHTDSVTDVAISPDGTWLTTASHDHTARIWDAATGQQRHILTGHTDSVRSVAINRNGTWLATASNDHTARIWDVSTGREMNALTGHTDSVVAIAISPDDTWLATASHDYTARIWDVNTRQERHILTGHTHWLWSVTISPDGTWLATVSDDGTARTWDATTGQETQILPHHTASIRSVMISPDGTWMATAGDGGIRIWDTSTEQVAPGLSGYAGTAWSVAISSDGTWIATTSSDHTVRVLDSSTGEEYRTLTGHTRMLMDISISTDGTHLASASSDHTVRIWDVAAWQECHVLQHPSGVWSATFSPDGTSLATVCDDSLVRVWDSRTGQERECVGPVDALSRVTISPDSTWLATTIGGEICIWDMRTGHERHTLSAHTGRVLAMAANRDGTWLATASNDHTARIWDVATGREIHTLTGHTGFVVRVAISPDCTWLATASYDNTIRIWDVSSGQARHILTAHTDWVTDIAIHPNGTWLASIGSDATVRIWDAATGTALAMMRFAAPAHTCAWSPNGTALIVGGEAGVHSYRFAVES